MLNPKQFQLPKIKKYVGLMAERIGRATLAPHDLMICDPAQARFDAPPADLDWRPFALEGAWGARNQWACFKGSFQVPAQWDPAQPVTLTLRHRSKLAGRGCVGWPAGPEGQVFVDGRRAGAIDQQHQVLRWDFKPGQTHEVSAVFFAARVDCTHWLEAFDLTLLDGATYKLVHDALHAIALIERLEANAPEQYILLEALEAMLAALDVSESADWEALPVVGQNGGGRFYASVPAAQKAFDAQTARLAGHAQPPHVVAVGHAHIDLAWLWDLTQTHHKCARTFATQCRLLEQYPDWKFIQSSPQAYAWIERDAPDLFEQIKQWIAKGRWIADGAAWCEFDTNVPSGESIVRHFLYGKRYFKEKLGVDSRMLWLPDVFGYNGALPQLMKLAGVDSFITSKISWNQFNRFPHDTFCWRGIDGTQVPTHFITTPCECWFLTYNAMMTVEDVDRNWSEYRQKALGLDPIMSFGWGDGGGGPTEKMLETATRIEQGPALASLPKIKYETPQALMERIEAQKDRLPVWDGELYLEYHRGTYTTQAWLKRANRKNEIRLAQLDWLGSLAAGAGFAWPKEQVERMWEDLMLMHFHDILPGSSVTEVYDETRLMQQAIADGCEELISQAAGALAAQVDTTGFKKPAVLFNTLGFDRTGPLELPGGQWRDGVVIPAGGWAVVELEPAACEAPAASPFEIEADGRRVCTPFWQAELGEDGTLARLFDRRAGREVLAPGQHGNQWQLFEDRPMAHDAWDIDYYFENHPLPAPAFTSLRVASQDAVRLVLELAWTVPAVDGKPASAIVQEMVFYASDPRIDFRTKIDWHLHHQLLKVAFPVDIRATRATYQIQFGHLERPTHRNTAWDMAQFEVCAHRFADLSEAGYGVALLNDCKYGYDIHDNVMRLTCLKSAQSPDPTADQGAHEFTYALLPHAGSFQQAGVIESAARLNVAPVVCGVEPSSGPRPAQWRRLASSSPAAVVETIKPAEDGQGQIMRLYEAHGARGRVELTLPQAPARVQVVDLLEEPAADTAGLEVNGATIALTLKPFQVVTLRVE